MSRNNRDRLGAPAPSDPSSAAVQTANAAAEKQGLSFVVPTEFVELPSRGKYYAEDHPLHNQEVVEIRHMTAKDEDILTSRSLLKKGLAIERLIQSVLVDKNVDVNSLLIGDKNAILVQTRIHAYGADYETRAICPACSAEGSNNFDLMEVGINYGDSWADMNIEGPTENSTFLIKLPKTGYQAEVRLLNGYDEKHVMKVVENRKKHRLQETPITTQMKQFVVSVDGYNSKNELNNFIDNMPTLDAQYLRVAYNSLVPNVDMALPFVCAECGTDSRLEVPFTADFFWPNR